MQMGCSNTGKSGLLALQSSTFQKPVVIKIQKEERWLISSIGFFDGVWKGTSYHEVINRMVNLLISLKHGALSYNQHFKIKKKKELLPSYWRSTPSMPWWRRHSSWWSSSARRWSSSWTWSPSRWVWSAITNKIRTWINQEHRMNCLTQFSQQLHYKNGF